MMVTWPALASSLAIHLSGDGQGQELRDVHRLIEIARVAVVGDRNPARFGATFWMV